MEKYVQGITQDIEKILTGFASEDDLQKEITGDGSGGDEREPNRSSDSIIWFLMRW